MFLRYEGQIFFKLARYVYTMHTINSFYGQKYYICGASYVVMVMKCQCSYINVLLVKCFKSRVVVHDCVTYPGFLEG